MSDMTNFPQHGDMCLGRTDNCIVSGHFVGMIKYMDGSEYAVLQHRPGNHQVAFVYYRSLEPYTGPIVYRDRSDEPGKTQQPFKKSIA